MTIEDWFIIGRVLALFLVGWICYREGHRDGRTEQRRVFTAKTVKLREHRYFE